MFEPTRDQSVRLIGRPGVFVLSATCIPVEIEAVLTGMITGGSEGGPETCPNMPRSDTDILMPYAIYPGKLISVACGEYVAIDLQSNRIRIPDSQQMLSRMICTSVSEVCYRGSSNALTATSKSDCQ